MSNIGTNIQVNRELIEEKKGWFWLSFRNFNPLQVGPLLLDLWQGGMPWQELVIGTLPSKLQTSNPQYKSPLYRVYQADKQAHPISACGEPLPKSWNPKFHVNYH